MGEIFESDLLKGEKIVWTGQPETKVLFAAGDILVIPLTLVPVFLSYHTFLAILEGKWFLIAHFLMVVSFSYYLIFGRFLYKNKKKRNTFYAVSNKRILSLIKSKPKNEFRAALISKVDWVDKSINRKGVGTLHFGRLSFWRAALGGEVCENTGLDPVSRLSMFPDDRIVFYDIKNADQVYSLIMEIKAESVLDGKVK